MSMPGMHSRVTIGVHCNRIHGGLQMEAGLLSHARRTGYEPISAVERKELQEQGFPLLRNVLTDDLRQRLESAVDRVYAEEIAAGRGTKDGTVHLLGFLTRDEVFADLLARPTIFPYVWGLAGWNIYTHHNHLDVTPPALEPEKPYWGWHQDGYRQNSDPEGAVEITANPGDAFIFDRRLWHSRSTNLSDITRKILFIDYTYRRIRPLDDMPIDYDSGWWAARTPVQRQLLGAGTHTANYWGINWNGYVDDRIPLRKELKKRGLLDRGIPWLR